MAKSKQRQMPGALVESIINKSVSRMLSKVAIMATKSDSLFTDDTSQITESYSEWFF